MEGSSRGGAVYEDQPSRSPWIAQFDADGPPRPLERDARTDVVIVGAGIAGVATAFFTLRATVKRVLLIERDRVGRGATGRNAGQLTTYFERPLCDIADEYGAALAAEAQGGFDDAHDLLDLMIRESGAGKRDFAVVFATDDGTPYALNGSAEHTGRFQPGIEIYVPGVYSPNPSPDATSLIGYGLNLCPHYRPGRW
jgi:glycine/D-amino acid oxidase-like deaminating enzyme